MVVFYRVRPRRWSARVDFLYAWLPTGLTVSGARWEPESTRFGAFPDPVADKVLVAIAMVLTEHYHSRGDVTCITHIAREIIILLCVNGMAELGKRSSVAVPRIGKAKTTRRAVRFMWPCEGVLSSAEYAGIALFFVARSGANVVVHAAIFERCTREICLISDRFAANFSKRS